MMRSVVVVCAVCLLASASVPAQEATLRAERTIDFRPGHTLPLEAKVGPVRVESVEFADLGKAASMNAITSRLRGSGSGSELSTFIRAHFLAENPSDEEWAVTFTIEFLDKSSAVIDRVTKRSTWEGEAKPYIAEHQLLAYVVPLIAKVRIKMEAKLD